MPGFFKKEDEAPLPSGGKFFDRKDEAPLPGPAEAPSDGRRALDIVADAIAGPAKKVAGMVFAPFEELDKVTGAPPRAAVGAVQRGEGFTGAVDAFADQMTAGLPSATGMGKVLPNTPSGSDIVAREMAQRGIDPKLAAGAPLAVAGMVADAGLDVTNIIPTDWAVQGVRAAANVGKGMAKVEGALMKPLFGTGALLTAGNINYEKALRAANELKFYQLFYPGNKEVGPLSKSIEKVGAARQALQAQNLTVPGSHEAAKEALALIDNAVGRTVSAPNALKLRDMIEKRMFETKTVIEPVPLEEIQAAYLRGKGEINKLGLQVQQMAQAFEATHPKFRTPEMIDALNQGRGALNDAMSKLDELAHAYELHKSGADHYITRQVQRIEPRDLNLDEIDDVIVGLDDLNYTGNGVEKLPKAIWTPAKHRARRILNDALNSIPEGQAFQQQYKTPHEALSTAATGRSRLFETLGTIGQTSGGSGIAAGFMSENPTAFLIGLASFVGSSAVKPSTYYRLAGAIKMPGDLVRGMQAALETGRAGALRDWLSKLAEKHPVMAETFVRGTLLAASKPEGLQALTADDLKHIGDPKSFDPEMIAAETERIANDDDMPSTDKAAQLSAISQRGYIVLPRPAPAAPEMIRRPPEPQKKPVDLDRIKNALKAVSDG